MKESKIGDLKYTDEDFNMLREIIKKHTGIDLSDKKKAMVYGRLARRIFKLNLDKFYDYIKILKKEDPEELDFFINAITTNLTSFFREKHHFESLRDEIFPQLFEKKKYINIWSAGCSNGQEPYSIAITIAECNSHWLSRVKILATDLDTNMLSVGESGVYSMEQAGVLGEGLLEKYFLKGKNSKEGMCRVVEDIRKVIEWKKLNFLENICIPDKFDIIFCRNVLIYFDHALQEKLIDDFFRHLEIEGYLFLGHSESMDLNSRRFQSLGKTIYRRKEGA